MRRLLLMLVAGSLVLGVIGCNKGEEGGADAQTPNSDGAPAKAPGGEGGAAPDQGNTRPTD